MSQIPEHLRDAQIDMSSLASDEQLTRARRVATEYAVLDTEIADLESIIKQKKERRLELQMRELPAVLGEIGIDRIGLPDQGVDVVVAPYYHANIAADWEEQRKEQAFSWLEQAGHGDVVRAVVSVSFSRGELPMARELEELIRTQFAGANSHPVSVSMTVP